MIPLWFEIGLLTKIWKGFKMKNYMMVNDKKIEISQETADNLEREFGETTYSIGDRLLNTNGDDEKYIIVRTGNKKEVVIVELSNGVEYTNRPVKVGKEGAITASEFRKIVNGNDYCFTRYWDSQRKVKT
jgi:hypothetical protein